MSKRPSKASVNRRRRASTVLGQSRRRPIGPTGKHRSREPRDGETLKAGSQAVSLPQGGEDHTAPVDAAPFPPLTRGEWGGRPEYVSLPIDTIDVDRSINPRFELDEDVIESLVQALEDGRHLPPLAVFKEDDAVLLADGQHRLLAHQRHGSTEVDVEQRWGSRRDAEVYAVYANTRHGTRLKREEVRSAIVKWLNDPAYHSWSNAEIARLCGCSGPTVKSVRDEHPLTSKVSSFETRMVMRGGRRVPMNTRNIGSRTAGKAPAVREPQREIIGLAKGAVPTPRPHRRTRGDRDIDRFVDSIESLIEDWGEPAKLGSVLARANGTVRRRFGVVCGWFGTAAAYVRGRRTARPMSDATPAENDDDTKVD